MAGGVDYSIEIEEARDREGRVLRCAKLHELPTSRHRVLLSAGVPMDVPHKPVSIAWVTMTELDRSKSKDLCAYPQASHGKKCIQS